MAEVVLFHHVQGLTEGVRAFADEVRSAGHAVHTPDLFAGETAATIEAGFELKKRIGNDVLDQRVEQALAPLPQEVVFAGFSFGVSIAQELAQTRPGVAGALLYEAFIPITGEWAFGPWPDGVPAQVHGMEKDPFFGLEGDLEAARELVATVGPEQAEVFVYPGDQHLFTDSSLPSYDSEATALVLQRSIAFLDRLG